MGQQKVRRKEVFFESCRFDIEICIAVQCEVLNCELSERFFSRGYFIRQSFKCQKMDCKDCLQFVFVFEFNFLLGVSKELKNRVAFLDRLQVLVSYSVVSFQFCEMQRIYFFTNIENEFIFDQDFLFISQGIKEIFIFNEELFVVQFCVQKRNIFKEDFYNLMIVVFSLVGFVNKVDGEYGELQSRKEFYKIVFFNYSFEMFYNSYYLNFAYFFVFDKRRVKYESLDDF